MYVQSGAGPVQYCPGYGRPFARPALSRLRVTHSPVKSFVHAQKLWIEIGLIIVVNDH